MQKITPFLWFDDNAEEAMEFYKSVFKNTKQGRISKYSEEASKVSGQPAGSVMVCELEIEGLNFSLLNGGPIFKFNEAVSFVIHCDNQDEVDYFWEKLSAVPESEQCGWLKDKFGVSWQVVPVEMGKLMSDPDPEKSRRVMEAMLTMKKIDINGLKEAYEKD